MSHFIERCEEHGTVKLQCRCPDKNKQQRFVPHDDSYCKPEMETPLAHPNPSPDASNGGGDEIH